MGRRLLWAALFLGACAPETEHQPRPPPAVERDVTIAVSVRGAGAIEASTLGFHCENTCELVVTEGEPVRLDAMPEASDEILLWEGACQGVAGPSCEFIAASGTAVGVSFPEAPIDECAGLTPATLSPPAQAIVTGNDDRRGCYEATTDASGNLAISFGGFGPNTTKILGRDRGSFESASMSTVVPRSNGFISLTYGQSSWDEFNVATWSYTGTLTSEVKLPGVHSIIFPAATGGAVVVSIESDTCPSDPTVITRTTVQRIGEDGQVQSATDVSSTGCAGASALSDATNAMLVMKDTGRGGMLGFPPERAIARWFSSDGEATTDWFEVGTNSVGFVMVPKVGGGALIGNGYRWHAALDVHSTVVQPAPEFAAEGKAVALIHAGRAYAVYPTGDALLSGAPQIEVFSASGKRCGAVAVNDGARFIGTGRDGTIVTLREDINSQCAVSWWPAALR